MKADGLARLRIEVTGIVQGVGFRPFVYRLAKEHGVSGWVENTSGGARIVACLPEEKRSRFLDEVVLKAPPAAIIDGIRWEELDSAEVPPRGGFEIRESSREGERSALVSPDLATCGDCLGEMLDPSDRRYRYPFTNCTNCGPRFTIIADIPYDRPHTTMAKFTMCSDCEREYHNPSNRRFHAQPNACAACGPRLWLEDAAGAVLPGDPIALAAGALLAGKIVAVKGLGGFQLACDATSDKAVSRLRERKRRYAKPLAVMVRDVEEAVRYCHVGDEERRLLSSPRAPIVLMREREGSPLSREVAPGLSDQGIFLPYTPVHHLLLREAGIPLVMTSGNVSEEPIARENAEARRRLAGIADYFLLHDRDILVRYDDSVTSVLLGREYPLRRARGYAPFPVILEEDRGVEVLALGAELKNTFCFLRGRHAFLSQHVGDLDNQETLRHFEEAMDSIRRLFSLRPRLVAHDLHPDYLSTQMAEEYGLPRVAVQHHHAHVAACLAENGVGGKVIGVSWDGTGYGPDGTVWGGEFLVCDEAEYARAGHLFPYPMPGGELCARDLVRMAFGVIREAAGSEEEAAGLFSRIFPEDRARARQLQAQLRSGLNVPYTSSAGRLFDAVAALVGLRLQARYEGQAACELEALASGVPVSAGRFRYPLEMLDRGGVRVWDTRPLVLAVVDDLGKGVDKPAIAAGFHLSLARGIVEMCRAIREDTGLERVALSGGVFQNRLLTPMVVEGLKDDGFTCLLHRRVPCNDGGISLGQAVVAAGRWERGLLSPD